MSDFRGAVLASILMAAVVALAIVFPYLGEQSGPIVVEETSGAGVEIARMRSDS